MAMQKNKHVWISVAVGLVIAGGAVAGNVTLPNTFQPNTPARASEMNANFTAVRTAVNDNFTLIGALQAALTTLTARVTSTESAITTLNPRVTSAENSLASVSSRLNAVEQQLLAGVPLVAVQGLMDAAQDTEGVWIDVGGATVSFSTTDPSTRILMTATGAMATWASSSWLRCGVRFLVDGSPLPGAGGPDSEGNLAMSPGPYKAGAAESLPFTSIEPYTVGPGNHTVSLQMTRVHADGNTATGFCSIFHWTFSRAKLIVQRI